MMELKNCPFCGSEVKVFDNHTDFTANEKRYGIMCPKCSARFGFANGYESKQITVRKFNKRTVDDASNARMMKIINNLIDESVEKSSDTYAKLALRELQVELKYALKKGDESEA